LTGGVVSGCGPSLGCLDELGGDWQLGRGGARWRAWNSNRYGHPPPRDVAQSPISLPEHGGQCCPSWQRHGWVLGCSRLVAGVASHRRVPMAVPVPPPLIPLLGPTDDHRCHEGRAGAGRCVPLSWRAPHWAPIVADSPAAMWHDVIFLGLLQGGRQVVVLKSPDYYKDCYE